MPTLHDHDRINEMQGQVAGLSIAMKAIIVALETIRDDNPDLTEKLADPLETAKIAMMAGDREADRAEAVGRARAADKPPSRPEPCG